jgi:hypothetical protein
VALSLGTARQGLITNPLQYLRSICPPSPQSSRKTSRGTLGPIGTWHEQPTSIKGFGNSLPYLKVPYSAQTTWKSQLISSAGRCEEHIDCIACSLLFISTKPYETSLSYPGLSLRPLSKPDDSRSRYLICNRLLHLCSDLIIQSCETDKVR